MLRNCKQILAIAIISAGFSGEASISAQTYIPKASAVVKAQNQNSEQNYLNLTDVQKQQFKILNKRTSQLIQDVLTPEQQATYTAELKKGDRIAAWRAMNLSKAQREIIIAINKSAKEESLELLTAVQLSQQEKRSASVTKVKN